MRTQHLRCTYGGVYFSQIARFLETCPLDLDEALLVISSRNHMYRGTKSMPELAPGGSGHSPNKGKLDIFLFFRVFPHFSEAIHCIALKDHPVVPQDTNSRKVPSLRFRYASVLKLTVGELPDH